MSNQRRVSPGERADFQLPRQECRLVNKMAELGRLKQVELRDIWENEAQHFTPWLAAEENLSVLADTLQMELEFEAPEMDVGPFRADILCRNADGGAWVLIENQLNRTNHSHLGQLLTYADRVACSHHLLDRGEFYRRTPSNARLAE